jgi:hypothetical protein
MMAISIELLLGDERPGRVVRRYEQQRASTRADRALDAGQVDRPGAVVLQVVGNRGHEIEPCQVLEQRIARLGDEHFVAGAREQLEQQRVRLAGARGQHDAAGVDSHALPLVVARHGFPCVESAERSRVVAERFGIGERAEQVGWIFESRSRGIGAGEVEHRTTVRPRRRHHRRQAVGRKLCRQAIREHRAVRE